MKKLAVALLTLTLADVSLAFADSTSGIPAAPKDWGVFIRNGLIAAGLWFAAMIAGRLWIAWRQGRTKPNDRRPGN